MIVAKNQTFYLETEHTSYVMDILPGGMLRHLYYGSRIGEDSLAYHHLLQERSMSPLMMAGDIPASADTIPQEYPVFGRGDYRSPALMAEGEQGRRIHELTASGFRIVEGAVLPENLPCLDADMDDAATLEISLKDRVTGVEILLYYVVLEKEDVIARHAVIRNATGGPVTLRRAASLAMDFERADFEFLTLSGTWARERHINRRPLAQGVTAAASRRGASGHQLNPFAALVGKHTTESEGEAYGFAFVYSGDFRIEAEVDAYDSTRILVGLNPETFSWRLEPGEEFTTPQVLFTYSDRGLNAMSQSFHSACRRHLGSCARTHGSRPVVVNSWEAVYYDLSEERLKEFIRNCRGLGIDIFVLDDGWFGHRDNDRSSLGDWFVDRKKFPEGLGGIIRCCHENGMKFGIWVEPEMVSKDSELYRSHPDWCIHCSGLEPVESRHQLVLDLSRAEVVDNLFGQLSRLLAENDISYVKWDFNRNLTDNGSAFLAPGRQGEHAHRYMLGAYELMRRLTEAFPLVLFEGCSGGGGRFDFGLLYYMPQIWTSDDSDAIERLKIQYGTSMVYPPAAMTAHVSACPNHQTGRTAPFYVRGAVAQMCHYGYEMDAGRLSETEREQVREQIETHSRIEPLLETGDFYRLENPFEGTLCAWQLVQKDGSQSYVCAVIQRAEPNPRGKYIRLRGLLPEKYYRVQPLGVTLRGDTLMHAGLPVLLPKAEEDNGPRQEEYAAAEFWLACVRRGEEE